MTDNIVAHTGLGSPKQVVRSQETPRDLKSSPSGSGKETQAKRRSRADKMAEAQSSKLKLSRLC